MVQRGVGVVVWPNSALCCCAVLIDASPQGVLALRQTRSRARQPLPSSPLRGKATWRATNRFSACHSRSNRLPSRASSRRSIGCDTLGHTRTTGRPKSEMQQQPLKLRTGIRRRELQRSAVTARPCGSHTAQVAWATGEHHDLAADQACAAVHGARVCAPRVRAPICPVHEGGTGLIVADVDEGKDRPAQVAHRPRASALRVRPGFAMGSSLGMPLSTGQRRLLRRRIEYVLN